jgi:hypothetical protein
VAYCNANCSDESDAENLEISMKTEATEECTDMPLVVLGHSVVVVGH